MKSFKDIEKDINWINEIDQRKLIDNFYDKVKKNNIDKIRINICKNIRCDETGCQKLATYYIINEKCSLCWYHSYLQKK